MFLNTIKSGNIIRMKASRHRAHQMPGTYLSPGHLHCRHRFVPIFRTNVAAPTVPPYSSSEDSEDSITSLSNNETIVVDLEDLAAAEESIAQQQAAGLPPSFDLAATKVKNK
jgi:hypothetical protein